MSFPFPALAILLGLIVILTVRRMQVTKKEEEQTKTFWDEEAQANQTRKRDISNLDYVKIPPEILSLPEDDSSDAILQNCRNTLSELSGKHILNLYGISNTELKLTYGAANLPLLSEYDDNFTQLARCLNSLGCRLAEADRNADAVTVLEFAVSCKSDIRTTYTTLGELYLKAGQTERVHGLIRSASSLPSLSRPAILEALNKMVI